MKAKNLPENILPLESVFQGFSVAYIIPAQPSDVCHDPATPAQITVANVGDLRSCLTTCSVIRLLTSVSAVIRVEGLVLKVQGYPHVSYRERPLHVFDLVCASL